MSSGASASVRRALLREISSDERPLVLAVSGGRDSMSLMHAMWAMAPHRIACVATFDHDSGPHSKLAVDFVTAQARLRNLCVHSEKISAPFDVSNGREAGWRNARYQFLDRVAAQHGAVIATAHTEDDQLETILMRVMRNAGTWGLAALHSRGRVLRPLLRVTRETLAGYGSEDGVEWIDDPGNDSRDFLRNRIRHDLLPALQRADSGLGPELLRLSEEAGALRKRLDEAVEGSGVVASQDDRSISVYSDVIRTLGDEALKLVWLAVAARIGLALDRRGLARLVTFCRLPSGVGLTPLAGGWRVRGVRGVYILERSFTADSYAECG